MSTGAHPLPHRVHWLRRWVRWPAGRPGGRRRHRRSASTERSFRARRGTRGRQSRAWWRGSRPAAAPSSSRRTARSRTGARSGSTWSSCLRSRSRPERTRSHISPADRETPPPRRRPTGAAVGAAEREPRHPARRPARHRAVETARCRRDAVRDADGDGRPRRSAGGARLPAARRDRQLLRRHGGTGLPEAPSLLGAHAHPLGRQPRSTSPSSTATPSTPSAPSTNSRTSAPRSPTAARRTRTGSASSASS